MLFLSILFLPRTPALIAILVKVAANFGITKDVAAAEALNADCSANILAPILAFAA